MNSLYCLLFALLLAGCRNDHLYREVRVAMGTFVEITSAHKEAADIAFKEIKRVEALLSKYDPESEVSRLNRSGALEASPETFFLVKRSKEFWQASGGAFDITVAPLVDLWGFTDKKYKVPAKKDIEDTLKLVGSDKIILREEGNTITFKAAGMKVDLGAIAKGYALDRAKEKLKEAGIKSCLLNAGGQIYALGNRSGRPWKIAVRSPRANKPAGYLELEDESASTSGDYEQFFLKDNARYAHIIDPKTGYPADSGIISVTVAAADGLTADALSTAIFISGKEKGGELIKGFPGAEIKTLN
ncbi:MAG: FAD:protein FMN transferase [Candidatus Omnitrophica bacterium]|nr:FAD:protein FMN transferase [Candidatus Omnitrophota bacterium]